MDRNEKINLAVTATIVLGSTAVFALSAIRTQTVTWKKMNDKVDQIKKNLDVNQTA